MSTLSVSVVVVSRDRPAALALCLMGLDQLDYPNFEIIVVADPAGCAAVAQTPCGGLVKIAAFDVANISAARNLGIAQAAGDIVAFIDDDAVPEPTWLKHLISPFTDTDIAASGGFVRGRNGIGFQWRARVALADGTSEALPLTNDAITVWKPEPGRAIKTEGTNMAVRRSVLHKLGGFDPAFAFYLDETDLNMRLADIATKVAIVPLAQVHHGYAASTRRSANRAPLDLTQIAASKAVFSRKHQPQVDLSSARDIARNAELARLLALMVEGLIGPDDVRRLLKTFDTGWSLGALRPLGEGHIASVPPAFLSYASRVWGADRVLSGRFWQARSKMKAARALVDAGHRVSLYLFSATTRYHSVAFQHDGFWLQRGGQFGKSDRTQRVFQFWRSKARLRAEIARVSPVRAVQKD